MSTTLVWLLLCAGSFVAASQLQANRHVVLLSIDGVSADMLERVLEDKTVVIPNLRDLVRKGVVAEHSETVFPSMTHPSHTTIITGVSPRVHGVLNNNMRNRETGEKFHITNKLHVDSVKVRTLFDAAKDRGLVTASFFWPENREDPSVDFLIPEVFKPDGSANTGSGKPAFLQRLRQNGIPIELYDRWYGVYPMYGSSDEVLTEAAAYVIREERPHLLAIHLNVVDDYQHRFGANHYLSTAALTMADYCLGLLREAVSDAGLTGSTTFFVVSDHGFQTVPYEVNLHALFSKGGLGGKVSLHPDRWLLFVELEEEFDPERDQQTLDSVLNAALDVPGVAKVVRPEGFHDLGYPRYEEDVHVPGQYLIIADADTHLMVDAYRPSLERRRKEKAYHGHGYLPSHPSMYPAFLAAGRGIRKGVQIGPITNFDIAPTIAHLLGLEMTQMEGRVLTEALEP